MLLLLKSASGGPVTELAAYNFDEASGAVVDVTGNGHGFTPDAAITRQTGHTNTGLRHESTAANSLGPAIFGQTANRTLMAWVKRTSNAVDGWILEMKDTVGDTGLWGFLFTTGNLQARCKNPSSSVFTVQIAQPVANAWYHLAMTFDGAKVHLFINGVEQGTGTTVTGGSLHTGATIFPFFDAVSTETVIDDVRVYDAALDAATITTLMGTPVTSGGTNLTQTPTDTEGLTDTRVFDQGKAATDPEALTDSARYDLGKVAADTLALTDTATVERGTASSAADNLNLTDAATPALGLNRTTADDLPLTDNALLERAVAQAAADTVALTDNALVATTRAAAAADTENLTDSAALTVGRAVTDNLGVTDQITTDRSKAVVDNAALTDSASVQLAGAGTVSAADALGLTDTTQVTSVRNQAAADTCGLSDQIALVITRDLGDTITVTDAADLTAAFVRVFADTAALTDSIALVVGGHGPAVQPVLTATNAPSSSLTPSARPVLVPSNAPSSNLEVSHVV